MALLLRVLYFVEHAASPFFAVPILDEKFYDAVARALLGDGDITTLNPGFRPWLYPLFLAFIYRLGGDWDVALAIAVQHLLGAVTAVLVADFAIRICRRQLAGWLAAGLYLLAGPPLFFEGELLITTLFTFLVFLQLWLIARGEASPIPAAWWLAAGIVLGLAIQARANAALFFAAYVVAAIIDKRRRRPALVAVAGGLVVLSTFAAWQARLTGEFSLLPGAGGVNLYLGNKVGADGMIPRQDRAVAYGEDYLDSVQVFAAEVFREDRGLAPEAPVEPAAVSAFWSARARQEIVSDPLAWLRLMARKTWLLLWSYEIPNNKSYAFFREQESRLLAHLPVAWWLLLGLAPVGVVFVARRGDRVLLSWLLMVLALHAAGVVMFFVNGRFRLPLWPGMAILAAAGLLALAEAARQRSWRHVVAMSAAVFLVFGVSLVNWPGIAPPTFARDYFYRSLAHLQKGDAAASLHDARASLVLDPDDPAARFQLANAALAVGDLDLAHDSLRLAAAAKPGEPRIANNLGIVLERLGRDGEAYAAYLEAVAFAPTYAPALVNVALLELRAGLVERAEAHIEAAEALGPSPLTLTVARAFLERDQGRSERAEELLAMARSLDADLVAALERDNRASSKTLFSRSCGSRR